jgi:hypothetical protein
VVLDGPNNREAFLAYVDQVLAPELRPGDVVIMDNLSSHKGADVHALGQACSIGLKFGLCGGRSQGSRTPRRSAEGAPAKATERTIRGLGTPSAVSSTCIRPPRAPTTSPIAATMQTDQKPL